MKSISLYVDKDTWLTRMHPFTKLCYIHDVAAIKKSVSDTNHIMRRGQKWKTVSKF